MKNKNLIWIVCFLVLSLWSILLVSDHKADFGLVQALETNEKFIYYTDGDSSYNMSDIINWYEFDTVNVIFLENDNVLAKKIVVKDKLPIKRSDKEIRKILEEDKNIIKAYPKVEKEFSKVIKKSSGSRHIVLTSGGY